MRYMPVGSSGPTWRPWSLRTPFLASYIVLCVLLCLVIELVIRYCPTTGCHVFGKINDNGVSRRTTFVYTQLPKILFVAFRTLWRFTHIDLLRMEPYFQLSKVRGATAAESLLLWYPLMDLPSIPVHGFIRRQWAVVLSPCILLLTNFFTAPLAGSIFQQAMLTEDFISPETIHSLQPGSWNIGNFTTGFLFVAYNYLWLNSTLPSFTTENYTILPIELVGEMVGRNETWIANTTLFEADFTCAKAKTSPIAYRELGDIGLNISSADGRYSHSLWDQGMIDLTDSEGLAQITNDLPSFNTTYLNPFITPWTSLVIPAGNGTSETYLYIWASQTESTRKSRIPKNLTALFCTPSYFSQAVTATFTMPYGNITQINRTSTRTPLAEPRGFIQLINGSPETRFEDPPGSLDSSGWLVGFGYQPVERPNVDSQLRRKLGFRGKDQLANSSVAVSDDLASNSSVYMRNVFQLPAFAIYNQTAESLGELLDADVFARTLERSVKLLFALGIAVEMLGDAHLSTSNGTADEPVFASRAYRRRGFVVDVVWARAAQVALAVTAILASVFTFLMAHRPCNLDGEPNTIAEGLRLLTNCPDIIAVMENAEYRNGEQLKNTEWRDTIRFELRLEEGAGPTLHIQKDGETNLGFPLSGDHDEVWIEGTWMGTMLSGVGSMSFIMIVIVSLLSSFIYSLKHQGLRPVGGKGSIYYKILYTFLPFAIGGWMEVFLIHAGLCYCITFPIIELMNGRGEPKILGFDYSKYSPFEQITNWALGDGATLPAALAIATLLAKVLIVALAALFSPTTMDFKVSTTIQTSGVPTVQGQMTESVPEMYYTLAGYLSADVSMLPWTTHDYCIIPFYPLQSTMRIEGYATVNWVKLSYDEVSIDSYESSAFAIGSEIHCVLLPHQLITTSCEEYASRKPIECPLFGTNQTVATYIQVNDQCWNLTQFSVPDSNSSAYSWTWPSTDFIVGSSNCPDTFFALWVERPANPHPLSAGDLYRGPDEAVGLKCVSTEKLLLLKATIKTFNRDVLSTSNFEYADIEKLYSANTSARLTSMFLNTIRADIRAPDDAVTHDLMWFNYLMAAVHPAIIQTQTNVTHLPNPSILVAAFEDIYRRLFAMSITLSAENLFAEHELEVSQATGVIRKDRVVVNVPMFVLALAILLYTVVVLLLLGGYKHKPHKHGHIPVSLMGTFAMLYDSTAKDKVEGIDGKNPKDRMTKFKDRGGSYTYGAFMGQKNTPRYGMYKRSD